MEDEEPFASLLKGDMAGVAATGEKGVLAIMAATHTGMTTDEFSAAVQDWIATAKHPTTGRLFTEMVYQPMLELLAYLRANGFKTFIVSGGGVEFMRPWTERVYGIPPEQVVGSSGKLKLEVRDGKPVLIKLPEIDLIDDKEGKPVGIQSRIGRRPIAAFGNSDGDLQMLQWAMAGPGARFALFVHHDDAAREFAYDRTDKLQQFNKGWDEAVAKGWTVVSMKDDWKTVFPRRREGESRVQAHDLTATRRPTPLLTAALLALACAAVLAQGSQSLPNRPDSLKFAAIGDNGTGERAQYEVATQMVNVRAKFPFDLVIMLGDNMYGSQRPVDFVNKFEKPYRPAVGSGGDLSSFAWQPRSTRERVLQAVQHERPALLHVRARERAVSRPR